MEYGLIGEKLGHSFSKDIHNLIGDYNYILKEIAKEDLNDFMTKKDFKAINVTIPYKQDVIPYLDYIDPNAKAIGAVNTIVNKDGKLFGYNTDFIGLKRLIEFTGLELKNKKVLILGTGGTSKTAKAVAQSLNAKTILKVSRSKKDDVIDYEEAKSLHNDADIIINTTPSGMFPNTSDCPIDLTPFSKLQGLVDVIYNPLKTNLVLNAKQLGLKANGGLLMLVLQAIAAAEFFFEKPIAHNKVLSIFNTILSQKQNYVLIGMPGCGKTTIGELLAQKTGKEFIDSDVVLEAKAQKTCKQIIEENGIDYFRDLESSVIKELSEKQNIIISTGGGAVLREENVQNLKHNGIVIFLDRDIKNIKPTESRPLSNSQEKLKELYDERYPVYTKACDFKINNNRKAKDGLNKILKNLNYKGGCKC